MQLINVTKQAILAQEVETAASFWRRFMGLMGTPELPENRAVILTPCSSIHTWFMKYPIDVIFTDDKNRVLKILDSIPPFRFGPYVRGASAAIELTAGRCFETGTIVGDIVKISTAR